MGYQWNMARLVLAIWLRLMRETLSWLFNFIRLIIVLPAIIAAILPSVLQSSWSIVGTVIGPLSSLYFIVVEVLSFAVWLYITLFFPIFPSVIRFLVGIDIAEVARATTRSVIHLFAAMLVIGSLFAVFTWIPAQADVQETVDRIVCVTIPTIRPLLDIWTRIVDFAEPLIPPINVFLSLIRDFLQEIFDGFVTLVVRGAELIALFFTGGANLNCDLAFTINLCNDDCFIRQLWCWFQDVLDFIIIDVVGGILCLLFEDPPILKNIMLNVIFMFINGIDLVIRMAAAVVIGEPNCLAVSDTTSMQGAFDIFSNQGICTASPRGCCVLERNISLVFFWYRALFGSVQVLILYFTRLFDTVFDSFFGVGIAGKIVQFLQIIGIVLDIILNFASKVTALALDAVHPFLVAIFGNLGAINNFIHNLINCVICTLSSLPGELLGAVPNALGNIISLLQTVIGGIIGQLGQLFNLISNLSNIVSNLSFGGGGFFLVPEYGTLGLHDDGSARFMIPLRIPPAFIDAVADLNSVDRRTAEQQIMLLEIYNGTMHLECGLSAHCTHMLTEERMEDQKHVPFNANSMDVLEHFQYWQCTARYIAARRLCAEKPNATTDPQYHLATMATWLPEEDVCKQTLEEDIMYKQIEFLHTHPAGFEHAGDAGALRNMPTWWLDTYIPCWLMYKASFPPSLYNETTGRYSRPERFMTEDISEPGKMEIMGAIVRMVVLGDLEGIEHLRAQQNVVHRGLGFVRNVVLVAHMRAMATPEHVAKEQRDDAMSILTSPPKRAHRAGKHSVYNYDKKDGGAKRALSWYKRKRMPDMDEFQQKVANYNWKHTFTGVLSGIRNDSLYYHQELGFVDDKDLVDQFRETRGVSPGAYNTLATFMRWSMPSVGVSAKRHKSQPRWRVPSRRIRIRHESPTARKLKATPPEGDFNLTEDVLRPLLDFVLAIIVLIINILAAFVRRLIPFLADALDDLAIGIENLDFANPSQFLDLVEDLQDAITVTYFSDIKEFLLCESPPFYDVNTNPNGEWKWPCLLQLKLPPILPRPPVLTGIIPWGTPCKGSIQACDSNLFNGDVTCPDGWEHCSAAPVFFEHGFDPFIYLIELADTPFVSAIDILRGPIVGGIVRLVLSVIVIITAPILLFFGRGDLIISTIGFSSLADVPFIGPIIFRYDGIFVESDFHNFCLLWWSASMIIPFLISFGLGAAFLLFLSQLPQIIPALFTGLSGLIYLPTSVVNDIETMILKFSMQQTHYVHVQRQNIISANGSNLLALVPDPQVPETGPDAVPLVVNPPAADEQLAFGSPQSPLSYTGGAFMSAGQQQQRRRWPLQAPFDINARTLSQPPANTWSRNSKLE